MLSPLYGRQARGEPEAAPSSRQPVPVAAVGRRLPLTWPLVVLFAAFPVWWALGISAFTWIIMAAPVLVSLVWRRQARVPTAFILWLAFDSWVLLSGLQLHGGTKIVTFSYRLALYVVAGLLFVYTYNLPRSTATDTKILRVLTIFWMIVVAGGFAGIVFGAAQLYDAVRKDPAARSAQPAVHTRARPSSLRRGSGLPRVSDSPAGGALHLQQLLGRQHGCAHACGHRRGDPRRARRAAQNHRWGAYRLHRANGLLAEPGHVHIPWHRGGIYRVPASPARPPGLIRVAAGRGCACLGDLGTDPAGGLIGASFASSHGNSDFTRSSASQLAIEGARQSPIFGYGEPTQHTDETHQPPIGTQGQLWMVLYSNGIPAAVFFIGFFAAVLWQTRRARGMAGLWLHTVPLIALPQIGVYGWLPVELQVVMVASALAYRFCWQPTALPQAAAPLPAGAAGRAYQLTGAAPPVSFRADLR